MTETAWAWCVGCARLDVEEMHAARARAWVSLTRYGGFTLREAMALPRAWVERFSAALDKMLSEENDPRRSRGR